MGSVSVLVATRNRDASLAQALRSLQWQTWSDWEAVIVDNGSTGKTRAIVEELADARLSYVAAATNLGECGGRNRALERATGEFVCYLDDDDLLPRRSLEERVGFLERHSQCGMVYAEYVRLEETDGTWKRHVEPRSIPHYLRKKHYDGVLRRVHYDRELTHYFLKRFNFVRGGTPLIRREALGEVGGFDEELELFGDYDLWLRLAARYPIRFLDRIAYIYRVNPASTSRRLHGTHVARQSARRLCLKHDIRDSLHESLDRTDNPEEAEETHDDTEAR